MPQKSDIISILKNIWLLWVLYSWAMETVKNFIYILFFVQTLNQIYLFNYAVFNLKDYKIIWFSFKVPNNFNFLQAMDLFFKTHHVFNQEFNPDLKAMMNYLQYFVYKMNITGTVSSKLRSLNSRINWFNSLLI